MTESYVKHFVNNSIPIRILPHTLHVAVDNHIAAINRLAYFTRPSSTLILYRIYENCRMLSLFENGLRDCLAVGFKASKYPYLIRHTTPLYLVESLNESLIKYFDESEKTTLSTKLAEAFLKSDPKSTKRESTYALAYWIGYLKANQLKPVINPSPNIKQFEVNIYRELTNSIFERWL